MSASQAGNHATQRDERGVALPEYSLMVGLFVVVSLLGLEGFANHATSYFEDTASHVASRT